jgi:hypothetical protein
MLILNRGNRHPSTPRLRVKSCLVEHERLMSSFTARWALFLLFVPRRCQGAHPFSQLIEQVALRNLFGSYLTVPLHTFLVIFKDSLLRRRVSA